MLFLPEQPPYHYFRRRLPCLKGIIYLFPLTDNPNNHIICQPIVQPYLHPYAIYDKIISSFAVITNINSKDKWKMKINNLFRYRNVWMGIAILMVIFFHSEIKFNSIILSTLQEFGYGGVDIFMFASGIGCYYSLQKNSDAAEFMKRRALKIMPIYLYFIVFWLLYKRLFFDMPITAIVGNLFGVQNFTGRGLEFNWYISAMWLMYLLAPFFASLAAKLNRPRSVFGAMSVLLLFTASFWYSYTYIISVARIPIFFLGMLVAKKALDGYEIEKRQVYLSFVVSILSAAILIVLNGKLTGDRMWLLGLLWYPFIAIVPGLCLGISLLCELLEKSKVGTYFVKMFASLGTKTFSIYLIHIFVLDIFANMIVAKGLCQDTNLNRLLLILPIALGCVLLEWAGKLLQKTMTTRKENSYVER